MPTLAIYPNDGWHGFTASYPIAGSTWDYTFTCQGGVILTVVDIFVSGNRFEVTDNGVSIGVTSVSTHEGDQIFVDYDGALADDRWSRGIYFLGPGNHSINGSLYYTQLTQSASGGVRITPINGFIGIL
jgi:hypothetical protein